MNTLQLALICFTVITVAAIFAVASMINSKVDGDDSLVGRILVINTKQPDDLTVKGTVHAVDSQTITLRDAVYLGNQASTAASGTVTVPRSQITTWQELAAA